MTNERTIKFILTVNYEIDGEADTAVVNHLIDAILESVPGVLCVNDDYAILINSTEIEIAK